MGAETEAALTLAPSPASVRVTCDCLLPYRVRSVRYYAQTAPGDAVVWPSRVARCGVGRSVCGRVCVRAGALRKIKNVHVHVHENSKLQIPTATRHTPRGPGGFYPIARFASPTQTT